MNTSNTNNGLLERFFNLSASGTNVRTELTAGLTTFLAMCYIIIVNPLILGETGMDMGAVFVATCIASAIGCFVMGFVGNYPIALAPGMGLNAYFTFAVVKGMGVPWQVALGAVFVSGIIFILFSFFKVREMLVNALPMGLKMSIAAGIGLFLSLIALKGSGIIIASEATLVRLGDIHQPAALSTYGVVEDVPSAAPATMAVESANRARFRRGILPSSSRPARWETPTSVPVESNKSTRKKTKITLTMLRVKRPLKSICMKVGAMLGISPITPLNSLKPSRVEMAVIARMVKIIAPLTRK